MVDAALDRFRQRALVDPTLRARLRAEDDPDRFAVLVVALAYLEGIDLTIEAVTDALTAARRRWSDQWV